MYQRHYYSYWGARVNGDEATGLAATEAAANGEAVSGALSMLVADNPQEQQPMSSKQGRSSSLGRKNRSSKSYVSILRISRPRSRSKRSSSHINSSHRSSSHIKAPEGLATTRGGRDSPHDPMILFTDHSKQLIFKLKIILNRITLYRFVMINLSKHCCRF